jgi:uncharacterized protein
MLFRVLLWIAVAYVILTVISRFLHGVARGLGGPRPRRDSKTPAVPLARDPVCGTYVVPSRALTSGSGRDVHYFCSERCRRQWARR